MFDATWEISSRNRVYKYAVTREGRQISYAEVLNLWSENEDFRSFFISRLADSPFLAYRWETPPITKNNLDRPFEFVLLDSPGLVCNPDRRTFADYFTTDEINDGIVVFENLGGDATLVVPSPVDATSDYSHLAAFVRSAPSSQQQSLWRIVGQTVGQQISEQPIWLSTAGGGVAWLHVRLDCRPKYYGYAPYRNMM